MQSAPYDPNRIVIVPYDAEWPQRFRTLALAVRAALGEVALRIDHVGSTAIPHLAAKPIIDIQIAVADLEPLSAFCEPLEQLGYVFRPANPDLTKRFFRQSPGQLGVHIHARRSGSFGQQFALLFRDFLRQHPEVAAEYAAGKTQLAQQYRTDPDGYTDAKHPMIWHIIAQADAWAQRVGWQPGPSDV